MAIHAIYVDANERRLRLIDWDISCIPHASPMLRSFSYAEGVDSRNHVLAHHVLKSTPEPFTLRESKGGRRWVLWVHGEIDRKTHGFRLALPKGPMSIVFWQPAVLVMYTRTPAIACSKATTDEDAVARLGQPITLRQRDIDALRVEWVNDCSVDYRAGPSTLVPVIITPGNIPTFPGACRCEECGGSFCKLQKCAQCKAAFYCGKECQKKAWKAHKPACKAAVTAAAAAASAAGTAAGISAGV